MDVNVSPFATTCLGPDNAGSTGSAFGDSIAAEPETEGAGSIGAGEVAEVGRPLSIKLASFATCWLSESILRDCCSTAVASAWICSLPDVAGAAGSCAKSAPADNVIEAPKIRTCRFISTTNLMFES